MSEYSSEKITRTVTLMFAEKFIKDKKDRDLIQEGKFLSGSQNAREKYFWLSSKIFHFTGMGLFVFSLIIMAVVSLAYHHMGYWNLVLYLPSWFLIIIGVNLEMRARDTKQGKGVNFSNFNLIVSVIVGSIIALIIASAGR